ncbi:MAG: hypothetical protein K2H74_00440 [Paramuribaculum sp.]|nr:hypothetical protein [Paramuribaculum sp.]
MKLKYIFMSMVLAATSMVGFTSCSDDNDAPVPANNKTDLVLSNDTRIKIGSENRVLLPIESGNGDYHAFSLAPEIADVIEENNQFYIEGYKNGTARIVVSDGANNYKQLVVSVYTTDNMTLSVENLTFVTPLGFSSFNYEAKVAEGNGGYTIESDNEKVEASIDEETGEISLKATSGKDPYVATITVHDCSGLSASFSVSVEATFDGFTQADIDEILAETESNVYGKCKDPSDDTVPYYFPWRSWGYGAWLSTENDGTKAIGWWMDYWGSDYGGLKIEYPASARVGEDVTGKLYFQYSSIDWYDLYQYNGTARVVEDNAERTVVIFWNVDLDNELINRAYVVLYKDDVN